MAFSNNYQYQNQDSVNDLLKCQVCTMPLVDPMSTPCQHTLCRQCITRWLARSQSCPECRYRPLQEKDLKPVTERITIQMLNQIKVKCKACGQTDLERGNFNDHIEKTCTNTTIACSAADIKCPWTGRRDQLDGHLATCTFESVRPVLNELITENCKLKEQVQQYQTDSQRQQTTTVRAMNTTELRCYNHAIKEAIDTSQTYSMIELSNKEIFDLDMEYIVQRAIIQKQCKKLDLSLNSISPEGILVLADVLQSNPILEELFLDHNRVSDRGAQILSQALVTHNTNLKVLYLGSNSITHEGVQYLANMMKINQTLNRLYLFENNIGDQGVQLLAQVLARHNKGITCMDLNGNRVETDATVDALVDMLKYNQSLKQLRAVNCNLSEASKTKIRDAIKLKLNFKLRI